jgi:hypothetical protein
MTWMRNGKDDLDDPAGDLKEIDQMLPNKKGQTPLERADDIDTAVNWIRNKGVSPDDDDEDVPGFSKLALLSQFPAAVPRTVCRMWTMC